MSAHLTKPVPLISAVAPYLPEAMNAIFERALARNPADRYQSCAEFVAALQEAAGSEVRHPAFTRTMVEAALPNRGVVDPDAPTMLRKGEGSAASALSLDCRPCESELGNRWAAECGQIDAVQRVDAQ